MNYQVALLQRIIDDLHDADMILMMKNYIEIMCIFLKQHYDSHSLRQHDNVRTHGISYGLRQA